MHMSTATQPNSTVPPARVLVMFVPFTGTPIKVDADHHEEADASYFHCTGGCERVLSSDEGAEVSPPHYTCLDCMDRMAGELEAPASAPRREIA